MAFRLAALAVVLAHLAFVVFVLVGGFVAWRRPGLLRLHVPAVAISAGLAVAGLDCPLTDFEKHLLRRAGVTPYRGGFVEHYLVGPVAGPMTPGLRLGLRILTVTVVAVAYAGVIWRRRDPHRREEEVTSWPASSATTT